MPKLSAKALVSALPYALKADFEEQMYKVYMTDSAWSLVVAVTGVTDRPARYIDIIRPKWIRGHQNRCRRISKILRRGMD